MSASRVLHVSPAGRDWIAEWEGGYRLKAYRCPAGVWTISAGVTRYHGGKGARVREGDVLSSLGEAVALFQRTLAHYESGVDALTRDDVSQQEFDALVSFAYNLGVSALGGSTLIKRANDYSAPDQIRAQLLRWIYVDGNPLEGLRRRRLAEAECWQWGRYIGPSGRAVEAAA